MSAIRRLGMRWPDVLHVPIRVLSVLLGVDRDMRRRSAREVSKSAQAARGKVIHTLDIGRWS